MVALSILKTISVLAETYAHMKATGRAGSSIKAIKASWATEMLKLLSVDLQISGAPIHTEPAVFIGNHLSYLDIALLMRTIPDISFVAKKELGSWPIFGNAARRAGTIFVDRSSLASRMQVKKALCDTLQKEPRPIAIFPSGTTSLNEHTPWKRGAFRIAQEAGIPVQAFRIRYHPLRTAAFIDDDSFLSHLLRACDAGGIHASIEFADPELVSSAEEACARWHQWCQQDNSLPELLTKPTLTA